MTTPQKIGINGWFLQFPFTGIGQYTIQLMKELSKMSEANQGEQMNGQANGQKFLVAVPNEACVELMRQEKITLQAKVIPTLTYGGKSIQKHFWEQYQMPKFFMQEAFRNDVTGTAGADVVWLPYPCVKWFAWHPCSLYKTIVTIHDTIPYTIREYSRGPLSALAHAMSRWAAKQADAVITVSETSANDIVRVCNIPREKIQAIHNGVSETFFQKTDEATLATTLKKFGLTRGEYFLYVGGYDSRKRVEQLVESYTDKDRTLSLVLVGNPPENFTQNTKNIITTGFLDERTLNALYDGARAFIHFSKAEGFNIPLAQALIKSIPCGVSDIAIHHEIAGNQVVYTDPDNLDSTKQFWEKMQSDSGMISYDPAPFREKYSWRTSAEQHMDIFKNLE